VHHGHQIAGRGGDQVQLVMHPAELVLEHDHREDAGTGADVAGARCDGVGGHHAGAGVTLWWAHRSIGVQRAGRVQQPSAGIGQRAGRLTGSADRRQQAAQRRQPAVGDQVIERAEHGGVIAAGADVDREHAAGVADAEDPLAGQLPMHIAGQGGQVRDPPDVLLVVQYGLIQVRDAPAVRDVVVEQCAQSFDGRPGVGVAPGPERGEQFARGVECEVAVHHRGHPQGVDSGQLHPVSLLDVGGQRRVTVLQTGPHRVERIRPPAVDELVLPAVAAHRERCVVRTDQHRLDPGRTQLDTECGPAFGDCPPHCGIVNDHFVS
jgi:hypothetical protein